MIFDNFFCSFEKTTKRRESTEWKKVLISQTVIAHFNCVSTWSFLEIHHRLWTWEAPQSSTRAYGLNMQLIPRGKKLIAQLHTWRLLTVVHKSTFHSIRIHVIWTKCNLMHFANNFVAAPCPFVLSIGSYKLFWSFCKFFGKLFLMCSEFFLSSYLVSAILYFTCFFAHQVWEKTVSLFIFIKNDWWTCLQNLYSVLAFYQIGNII